MKQLLSWVKLDPDFDEQNPKSRYNYGNGTVGPWVLGIHKSKSEVRFIVIPDRRAENLLSVIQDRVAEGTGIVADERSGYCCLCDH